MPNHPNRGRRNPASNPSPKDIAKAREAAGLTQLDAANLVHCGLRSWQHWEDGDRRMHPAIWELFKLKVNR
jgi:DNA-binding transcriptional regulator YiaG